MRHDFGYMEDGRLGRPYNVALIKRLLKYGRPFLGHMLLGIVLVAVIAGAELVLPYLTRLAIDKHIVVSAYKLTWKDSQQRLVAPVVDRHGYYPAGKNSGFITGPALKEADPKVVARLRGRGILLPARVYYTRAGGIEDLVKRYPGLMTMAGGRVFIRYNDLKKLRPADLKRLRRRDLSGLTVLAAIFLGLILIHLMAWVAQVVILETAGQKMMHGLRLDLFGHLLGQSLEFWRKQPIGRLVTRTTNDVQNIAEMLKAVVNTLFQDLFLIVGIVIVLIRLDLSLALVCFALMPLIAGLTWLFSFMSRNAFRLLRDHLATLNAFFQETLSGIRELNLFHRRRALRDRFDGLNQNLYQAGLKQIFVFAAFAPLIDIIAAAALGLILWYGGGQVIQERLSLGVLVAFIAYIQLFFRPIRDLAEKYNLLQSAMASAERIFELKDTDTALPNGHERLDDFGGRIELKNVHFAFRPDQPVLTGVSFTAEPGETVALVGATGAGKSSIIQLLLRFYLPQRGEILLDGIDISQINTDDLRRQAAVVMQDVFLFEATVAENIGLGLEGVTRQKIVEAAKMAEAHEFIQKLRGGYDHLLTGGGATLSAGQKQLLAFARALVRRPKIFILDEATSQVDPATEGLIQRALSKVIAGRTTIIIAHRLSTIRRADRICVLAHGRVVETGTHDQLMAGRGTYHRLVELQEGNFGIGTQG